MQAKCKRSILTKRYVRL